MNRGETYDAQYSLYGGRPRLEFKRGFAGMVTKVEKTEKRAFVSYFDPNSKQTERVWVDQKDLKALPGVVISGETFCGGPTIRLEVQLLELIFTDDQFDDYAQALGDPSLLKLWHSDPSDLSMSHSANAYSSTEEDRASLKRADAEWRAVREGFLRKVSERSLEGAA